MIFYVSTEQFLENNDMSNISDIFKNSDDHDIKLYKQGYSIFLKGLYSDDDLFSNKEDVMQILKKYFFTYDDKDCKILLNYCNNCEFSNIFYYIYTQYYWNYNNRFYFFMPNLRKINNGKLIVFDYFLKNLREMYSFNNIKNIMAFLYNMRKSFANYNCKKYINNAMFIGYCCRDDHSVHKNVLRNLYNIFNISMEYYDENNRLRIFDDNENYLNDIMEYIALKAEYYSEYKNGKYKNLNFINKLIEICLNNFNNINNRVYINNIEYIASKKLKENLFKEIELKEHKYYK